MSDILLTEQLSASATPAAGRVVIYPKNDGYLYFKNDTGVETRVNPQTVATAAEWTAANPTLAAGVFGVESDTMKFKIGDGTIAWVGLAYWRYTAEHITINTTGGNTVLTTPQSRASSMAVTGALTSNVNIITPDVMALFVAENLTTGAFTVTFKTAAGSGIVIPQDGHIPIYADGTNVENPVAALVGSDLTLARIAGSTYSTIQHWRNNFASAGIIAGGVISDAGGATINVTGGSCAIRATTSHLSTLYFADFPANNGIAIPANTIRYVGVEYNAGAPIIAIRATDDFDYMTNFPVAAVTNEAGTLHFHTADRHDISDTASHIAERFEHTANFARDEVIGGLILGETGTRNITMSAGAMWQKLLKLTISAFNSSTGGTFDIYYRDGAGSFTKVAAATQWPNLQYDNGTGTLATLANNKYGTLWFYLEADDSMIIMLYGRAEHGSIAAAEAEAPPATVPNRVTAGARIIGKLVFAKSAATASSISSIFTQAFATTGASNHANLSNLDYASAGHTGFAAIAGSASQNFAAAALTSTTTKTGSGNNFVYSEPRTDGVAGRTNYARVGGIYSTNSIPGAFIGLNAEGSGGQRGSISLATKALDNDTTQPVERVFIDQNGVFDALFGIRLEATVAPTLAGTWTNLGAGQTAAGYFKDPFGIVHLQGAITGGGTDTIFTLPSGYRPAAYQEFGASCNNLFGLVTVDSAGVVACTVHGDIVLNGITFRAA